MNIRNLKKRPYKSMKKLNLKFIPTGIEELDEALNDIRSGTVTIITGRPSEGKSTLVHQILASAVDSGAKTLLVDGEHDQEQIINSLFQKVIGNEGRLYDLVKINRRNYIEPKPHVQEMLNDWVDDRIHICSKYENDLSNFEVIFELFNSYCKIENIDFIIMDNLMSLVDSTNAEMNARQSRFMKACTTLAIRANIPIVLVAHPNGTARPGEIIDMYQISGTSDIPNLADTIIQVIKNPTGASGDILSDAMIHIIKNRYGNVYKDIYLGYSHKTQSLCEISKDKKIHKEYDWRRAGVQNVIEGCRVSGRQYY